MSQGKTSSKAWGQRMASMPGTKCIKQFWYCMLYPHVIHIHTYHKDHTYHTCMHIYIYPHIMPYCNINVFSMKCIFERLKMMRKGCTWWDSAGLHTFNWSCTYWSSVMSGDKPSNSSQATGECIKRWYLKQLWRVNQNEEYWNIIHLSFLMSQTFEVSFLDLLELCHLHL